MFLDDDWFMHDFGLVFNFFIDEFLQVLRNFPRLFLEKPTGGCFRLVSLSHDVVHVRWRFISPDLLQRWTQRTWSSRGIWWPMPGWLT